MGTCKLACFELVSLLKCVPLTVLKYGNHRCLLSAASSYVAHWYSDSICLTERARGDYDTYEIIFCKHPICSTWSKWFSIVVSCNSESFRSVGVFFSVVEEMKAFVTEINVY